MQPVNVKGYGVVPFPDDISVDEIRATLRRRYTDLADNDLLQGASEYGAPTNSTVAPYEPSLMEKASLGIGSALHDSGIISNKSGAYQIGKNVAAIGEVLPGVGDVAAADDFVRAKAKGDNLGMGLAVLGVLPVAGDLAGKAGKAFKANQGAANMDAMLDLLKPKGQAANIGFEMGSVKKNGIAKFTSPNGSTRYVMMDGGEPVSALQIMSRDGKDGVISNVFTLPSNQKKGLASKLMSKAKKDFKSIKHSDELTEQGARFANSVEGTSQAPVDVASSIKAFHGTPNKFDLFDIDKIGSTSDTGMFGKGFYFTDNQGLAKTYAKKGGRVIEADLNLKNPYVINSQADIPNIDVPNKTKDDLRNSSANYSKLFTEKLQEQGYDGVIDNMTGGGKQFVVFDPKAIKQTSQAPVNAARNIKPVGGKKLITNGGDEYFELPSGEIVTDLNSKDVIFKDAKEAKGYLDGLYSEGSYKYNAVQQGYTGEIKGTKAKKNKLYHGTSDDIESFDKSKLQARDDGAIGTGVYVTSSPKIAESYANMSSPRFKSDKTGDYVEPNIIPISTRAEKTKIFSLAEKLDFMKEMNGNRNFSKELTEKLKKEGYDSSAVVDVNGDLIEMNIFEPEMVRASHAKFDPKNKGSASLLGGLGALGVGIGSRSRSDEEYE